MSRGPQHPDQMSGFTSVVDMILTFDFTITDKFCKKLLCFHFWWYLYFSGAIENSEKYILIWIKIIVLFVLYLICISLFWYCPIHLPFLSRCDSILSLYWIKAFLLLFCMHFTQQIQSSLSRNVQYNFGASWLSFIDTFKSTM